MPGDHGLAAGKGRGGGGGTQGDRSVLQGRHRRPSFRRPAVDPGVHPICEGATKEDEEDEEDKNWSMNRAQRKAVELRLELGLHGEVDVEAVANFLGMEVVAWPLLVLKEMVIGDYICVAKRLDSGWRRWVIAHAIGHRLMHPRQPHVDTIPYRTGTSIRTGSGGVRPLPSAGCERSSRCRSYRVVGGGGALWSSRRAGTPSGAFQNGVKDPNSPKLARRKQARGGLVLGSDSVQTDARHTNKAGGTETGVGPSRNANSA